MAHFVLKNKKTGRYLRIYSGYEYWVQVRFATRFLTYKESEEKLWLLVVAESRIVTRDADNTEIVSSILDTEIGEKAVACIAIFRRYSVLKKAPPPPAPVVALPEKPTRSKRTKDIDNSVLPPSLNFPQV